MKKRIPSLPLNAPFVQHPLPSILTPPDFGFTLYYEFNSLLVTQFYIDE